MGGTSSRWAAADISAALAIPTHTGAFVTSHHVDLGTTQPASYNALMELHHASVDAAVKAGISTRTIELVKIRASQINGCAYCLRLHTTDAITAGETQDRLAVLPAWRETQYFSDVEQAALRIAEFVTNISIADLPEDVYAHIAQILTPQQVAAIHWLAIVINAFNRVAISGHIAVAPA